MEIIIIYEDNHGVIGVAKDYESAIDCLLQDYWLNSDIEIFDRNKDKWLSLKELGIDIGTIREWDIDKFNDFFEGYFFLGINKVWGM